MNNGKLIHSTKRFRNRHETSSTTDSGRFSSLSPVQPSCSPHPCETISSSALVTPQTSDSKVTSELLSTEATTSGEMKFQTLIPERATNERHKYPETTIDDSISSRRLRNELVQSFSRRMSPVHNNNTGQLRQLEIYDEVIPDNHNVERLRTHSNDTALHIQNALSSSYISTNQDTNFGNSVRENLSYYFRGHSTYHQCFNNHAGFNIEANTAGAIHGIVNTEERSHTNPILTSVRNNDKHHDMKSGDKYEQSPQDNLIRMNNDFNEFNDIGLESCPKPMLTFSNNPSLSNSNLHFDKPTIRSSGSCFALKHRRGSTAETDSSSNSRELNYTNSTDLDGKTSEHHSFWSNTVANNKNNCPETSYVESDNSCMEDDDDTDGVLNAKELGSNGAIVVRQRFMNCPRSMLHRQNITTRPSLSSFIRNDQDVSRSTGLHVGEVHANSSAARNSRNCSLALEGSRFRQCIDRAEDLPRSALVQGDLIHESRQRVENLPSHIEHSSILHFMNVHESHQSAGEILELDDYSWNNYSGFTLAPTSTRNQGYSTDNDSTLADSATATERHLYDRFYALLQLRSQATEMGRMSTAATTASPINVNSVLNPIVSSDNVRFTTHLRHNDLHPPDIVSSIAMLSSSTDHLSQQDLTAKFKSLKTDDKTLQKIDHSAKFVDDVYEYRFVILPRSHPYFELELEDEARQRLMKDSEWRALGIRQTRGWEHYGYSLHESNVLLFRRPLGTDPRSGKVAKHHQKKIDERRCLLEVLKHQLEELRYSKLQFSNGPTSFAKKRRLNTNISNSLGDIRTLESEMETGDIEMWTSDNNNDRHENHDDHNSNHNHNQHHNNSNDHNNNSRNHNNNNDSIDTSLQLLVTTVPAYGSLQGGGNGLSEFFTFGYLGHSLFDPHAQHHNQQLYNSGGVAGACRRVVNTINARHLSAVMRTGNVLPQPSSPFFDLPSEFDETDLSNESNCFPNNRDTTNECMNIDSDEKLPLISQRFTNDIDYLYASLHMPLYVT